MQQYQHFAIWLLAFGFIGAYSKGIQQPELNISELTIEQQESRRAQVYTKNSLEDVVPIEEGIIVKRARRNPHPGKIPDRIRDGQMQTEEREANQDEVERQRLQTLRQEFQQMEQEQRRERRLLRQQQHRQQENNARTRPQYLQSNNKRPRN